MKTAYLVLGALLLGLFIAGCIQQPIQQPECTITKECPKDKICVDGACKSPPECRQINEACSSSGDCCGTLSCGEYKCIQLTCADGTKVKNLNECKCPATCDDNNLCTIDYCDEKTNYMCVNRPMNASDFKNEFPTSRNIAVIMDFRYTSLGDIIMDCRSHIVRVLVNSGITPTSWMYTESDTNIGGLCFKLETGSMGRPIGVCEAEFKAYNSTRIYIRYNHLKNSVSFCGSEAVIEGDGLFLVNCSLAYDLSRD